MACSRCRWQLTLLRASLRKPKASWNFIMAKITTAVLQKMKQQGEKISMLTAYDASFAKLFAEQGVDILLIGDSLGMVLQGHSDTLPVTIADIAYHTRAVRAGANNAFIIASKHADMLNDTSCAIIKTTKIQTPIGALGDSPYKKTFSGLLSIIFSPPPWGMDTVPFGDPWGVSRRVRVMDG